MIKLKDILIESMSKNKIMDIVNKVYPQIVKDLGGKKLPIEVHSSIWHRVGAVGAEELMEDDNPAAQYEWDEEKIYVYYAGAESIEEIIRSLLHEHTHSLQDRKKFDKLYKTHTYQNHPMEKEADRAEENWKKYI
jgi:Zn-dependent peptidase ImmA (M78 family)